MNTVAPQAPSNIKPASLKPPKQTKLLGAVVKDVGLITTVSAELPWCFVLIERPDGSEAHAFVADLRKDMLTFPAEPQEYVKMTRRVGYGLFETVLQLKTVEFSDLTHVSADELEAA